MNVIAIHMFPVFPQFVMELTFSEAAKGVNKELNVNIDDACPRCDGNGSEPGTKVSQCHYCNGTGMVSFRLKADSRVDSRAFKPSWFSSQAGFLPHSVTVL